MIALFFLSEHYLFRIVGVKGPSMLPTLDTSNNLILLDCLTTRFLRAPRRGEIVLADNPFKEGNTIVKRVLFLEGEEAEVYDSRTERRYKVVVPKNHVWVEGDNKSNSRDSRDFGPISLSLVNGVVRARVWPPAKAELFH